MTRSPPVSNDELQAFFDQQLPSQRANAVKSYLSTHPEMVDQLRQDAEHRTKLRNALQSKFDEPIPARLRIDSIVARNRKHRRVRFAQIAAAVILAMGGGAGGWFANDWASTGSRGTRTVVNEAVDAYRTFSVEVRHPVEVAASDKAHLIQWLSNRLQTPIKTPDLSELGFRLMGGRVLPSEHVPAAQLMYVDDTGARLTVYVEPVDAPGFDFRYSDRGGVQTVAWGEQGMAFAVTAKMVGESRLLAVAHDINGQLAGPARIETGHENGL